MHFREENSLHHKLIFLGEKLTAYIYRSTSVLGLLITVTRKFLKYKAQEGQEIYLHRQIHIEAGTQSSSYPIIITATIPCNKGAGALRRPHVSITYRCIQCTMHKNLNYWSKGGNLLWNVERRLKVPETA